MDTKWEHPATLDYISDYFLSSLVQFPKLENQWDRLIDS